MGQTIPSACQDWASTKAAYRFLSNDRVSEHHILSGHFQESAERVKATDGPVLTPSLVRNVIKLAQLGGYLARASDPLPGNIVMWRVMRRLTDIQIGYELALKR